MCRNNCVFVRFSCFLFLIFISLVFGYNYQQEKIFLDGFRGYLNNLPNQPYYYEDGLLLHAENTEDNFYKIEVSLKVSELNKLKSFKLLRCTAQIEEFNDGIVVVENSYECHEDVVVKGSDSYEVDDGSTGEELTTTEGPVQVVLVNLENEVQPDNNMTSGERFVAVPRAEVAGPDGAGAEGAAGGAGGAGGGGGVCAGCTVSVDVEARGVPELAQLGVAHLDRHEPGVAHTLHKVLSVNRQVQVVNGVRYVMLLEIGFNNCSRQPGAAARSGRPGCSGVRTCRVTVLEKPWARLSDGSKFRAILSNNCTAAWLFDEEVISQGGDPNNEDVIKVVHEVESQAHPTTERTLTDDELRILQEQIITDTDESASPERGPAPGDAPPTAAAPAVSASPALAPAPAHAQPVTPLAAGPAPAPARAESPALSDWELDMLARAESPQTDDSEYYAKKNSEKGEKETKTSLSDDQKRAIDDAIESGDNAKRARSKRSAMESGGGAVGGGVLGGARSCDPASPRYWAYAQEALRRYLHERGLAAPHRVHAVLAAREQLVSGLLTIVDFQIAPNDTADGDPMNCTAKVWEQTWKNFKELKVTCVRIERLVALARPDDTSTRPAVDPKYRKLTEECTRRYVAKSGKTVEYKVISLELAEEVGEVTRLQFRIAPAAGGGAILRCVADARLGARGAPRDVDVNCSLPARPARRAPPPPPRPQDPAAPRYRALAAEAMRRYLAAVGAAPDSHALVSVDRVSVQVLAGTLTRIAFTIGPASDEVAGDDLGCDAEIWEKPWMNFEDIKVDCRLIRRPRKPAQTRLLLFAEPVPGAQTSPAPLDETRLWGPARESRPERHRALAQRAMEQHLAAAGDVRTHRLLAVDHVELAGPITKIDFRIAPLGGKRGDTARCYAELAHERHLRAKQITVDCERKWERRGNPGLAVDKDAADPRYRALAEEALSQWAAGAGGGGGGGVLAVRRVTAQAMSGTVTTIHFDAESVEGGGYARMPLDCRAEVWEKPWIHFKKIDVDCRPTDREKLLDDAKQPLVRHARKNVHVQGTAKEEEREEEEEETDPEAEEREAETRLALAEEALRRWQGRARSRHAHRVLNVTLAERRAAGAPLRLRFTAARTRCAAAVADAAACRLQRPKVLVYCHARIWQKVWTDGYKEMNVNCGDLPPDDIDEDTDDDDNAISKRKRSLNEPTRPEKAAPVGGGSAGSGAGGGAGAGGGDPEMSAERAAREAVEQLNAQEGLHKKKLQLTSVFESSGRAAPGHVLTVRFQAAYAECSGGVCSALPGLGRRCAVRVYVRAWLRGGRYLDVTCDPERASPNAAPRASPPPARPREPDEPAESNNSTELLAQEALRHIEAKYPHPRRQRVVRVVSLQRQRAAGDHYRLRLVVGYTRCWALSETPPGRCAPEEPGAVGAERLCRANVWEREGAAAAWRVSCDEEEEGAGELRAQRQAERLFAEFVAAYKRPYGTERAELARRFLVFKENLRRIQELNTHERGTARYAVTRFADLTPEEFSRRHLGLRMAAGEGNALPRALAATPPVAAPEQFDWRTRGVVTDVKNQGSCGSCWAFSVTGNVEGQLALKTGQLVSLSEQELVDCDRLDHGCEGGLPDNAYRAIEELGGLEAEAQYPYEGADERCSFNRSLARVRIHGAVNISTDESDMAKWLVQNGPISIGINANAMQFYVGGISHPLKVLCNPANLDHGVLIVGYGIKVYPLFNKRLPYWIVKNSWGARWGEQGYYRVYRGDGTCGLNLMASSALL